MTDYIVRAASSTAARFRRLLPNSVPLVHLDDTNELAYRDGSSSTGVVRRMVTKDQTQTLTAKSLTAPTITGVVQWFAAAATALGITQVANQKTLVDNVVTDFFTVTVPNAIHGGSIDLIVSSMLGDGDSTDTARYTVGISRITGAATKAVISAKSIVGATAGAGANAVITAAISAMTGAVGATQTFTVTIKNARSAGAADNHPTIAVASLMNQKATGITIAAA